MSLRLLCSALASASSNAGRTMVTGIPCLAEIPDFSIDSMWRQKGNNNHGQRWCGFQPLIISSIPPVTKLWEGGSSQPGLQPHQAQAAQKGEKSNHSGTLPKGRAGVNQCGARGTSPPVLQGLLIAGYQGGTKLQSTKTWVVGHCCGGATYGGEPGKWPALASGGVWD